MGFQRQTWIQLLCGPIRAPDQIPDRFYVISMEILSLRRRHFWQNVSRSEEHGEINSCFRRLQDMLSHESSPV